MTIGATAFFGSPTLPDPRVEAAFYSRLKMRNATFKSTRPGRFADIDPALVAHAARRLPKAPQVLDVAVSTGVSTVELVDALRRAGFDPSVTATDLFLKARIVQVNRRLRALIDPGGWPLQYEIAGWGIRPWIRRLDYLTFAWIARGIARRALADRLATLAELAAGAEVALVSPRLAQLPSLDLVEDDVLQRRPGFVGRFDLIRAANILNRGYFSREQLAGAITHLRGYLRGEGALLLVTRSGVGGEPNHGTLFEAGAGGILRPALRFGAGSEIEDVVLEVAG